MGSLILRNDLEPFVFISTVITQILKILALLFLAWTKTSSWDASYLKFIVRNKFCLYVAI